MKKSLLFTIVFAMISCFHSQTTPINTRLIEPTNTIGYFNESFVHHLKSSTEEFFLSTLASGTTEYFGISNATSNRKYISRIGANGLPVWNAIMQNASKLEILNSSQDFACIDNDDNIYIIC